MDNISNNAAGHVSLVEITSKAYESSKTDRTFNEEHWLKVENPPTYQLTKKGREAIEKASAERNKRHQIIGPSRVMPTQLSLDLRAARQLIEVEANWYSGRGEGIDGKCVLTACCTACAIPGTNVERYLACVDSIRELLPEGVAMIQTFNDTRKHEEVLDLFDRAIKAADSVVSI